LVRGARGVELTPAGKVFLDHARLILAQVETAREAARRAVRPSRPIFALGFLTGQEMDWLPAAMRLLRDELPNIDVTVSSQYSPALASALSQGKLDAAFMRREAGFPALGFKLVAREPLSVVLGRDHRLAARDSVSARDIAGETFITVSKTAPALRTVIDDYINESGLELIPRHEADNLAMAISLVASTGGVALLPAYARNFLPSTVTSRMLAGKQPSIDLVLGFSKTNTSAILKLLLSRLDALIASA
jgi:LysR family hca operon transcriptional activator